MQSKVQQKKIEFSQKRLNFHAFLFWWFVRNKRSIDFKKAHWTAIYWWSHLRILASHRISKVRILQICLVLFAQLSAYPFLLLLRNATFQRFLVTLAVLPDIVQPPNDDHNESQTETSTCSHCSRDISRGVRFCEDLATAHISHAGPQKCGGTDDGFFRSASNVWRNCISLSARYQEVLPFDYLLSVQPRNSART